MSKLSVRLVLLGNLLGCTLLAAAGSAWTIEDPERLAPGDGHTKRAPIGIVPTVDKARTVPPQPDGLSDVEAKSAITTNGIAYHDGSILAGQTHVYFIWYGNWNGNTATSLLPQFVNDLNRTLYYNTNINYSQMEIANDASGHIIDPYQSHVANSIAFGGQIFDGYSFGTSLDDSGVQNVVTRALSHGLPLDHNGIYFVLTSADVNVTSGSQSLCTNFCGYHSSAVLRGAGVLYGFIGNPARCHGRCTSFNPPLGSGPNGNPAADAMINILAHEINETVTDPGFAGWFRGSAATGEVGDLCVWKFGPGPFGPNPNAPYNVTFNGRHYLIQENYLNAAGGYCALGFSTPNGTAATATLAVTGVIGCSSDGGCEEGQIQIQLTDGVTTVTETVPYDGSGFFGPSDVQGIANALASALNGDARSPVTATVTQQDLAIAPTADPDWWLNLTTKQVGLAANQRYVYSVSITPFGGPAQGTTLAITPSPGTLSGGSDPCCSQ